MSYDYERYDGKRYTVDGEVIGLLAMEFGHEVEQVYERYHAEPALTEEQEIQAEAYRKSLCNALLAQYMRADDLRTENAKLRELVRDFDKCLTEAVRLAYIQGHATIYDSTLLDSLHPRMRDLKIEVPDE